MNWIPIGLVTFKVLVFGAGMFFAIKWHYDQSVKEKGGDKRSVLRAGAKFAAIFMLALLVLIYATFSLGRMLGLDLTLP